MQHFHMDRVAYKILKKERTNIDRAMMTLGLLGPIATIPQIWTIFSGKTAAGVSLLSWIFYLITALFSLAYSVIHKLRPLIFSNILWIGTDIVIIVGCVMYG